MIESAIEGGEVVIMDFGIPRSAWTRAVTSITRWIEPIDDNIQGKIPQYLEDALFVEVTEKASFNTTLGTVSIYGGCKPQDARSHVNDKKHDGAVVYKPLDAG